MPNSKNHTNAADANDARTSTRRLAKSPWVKKIGGASRNFAVSESSPLLDGVNRNGSSSRSPVENEGSQQESECEGCNDLKGLSWWKTPSMYWLIPPFFLFSVAIGGITVPRLNMILSLVCRSYFTERHVHIPANVPPVLLGGDNPQCKTPEIEALATKFSLYLTVTTGILSAVMAPKLGLWSDRYGRVRILVVTSLGSLLGEIITIIVATDPGRFNYNWLLLGASLDGLCGSFIAGSSLTYAYVADCTAPAKLAVAFGYFHACVFSGVAVGPLITAFLYKKTGSLFAIFYAALSIHVFFCLFVFFIVPESLTMKRQILVRDKYTPNIGHGSWSTLLQTANLFAPLRVLFPTGPGTSTALRINLILLATVDMIIFVVAMGAATVIVYYLGYRFNWDTAQISIFTSVVNFFRVSGLIILLPLLNYLFRTRRAYSQGRASGVFTPLPNSGLDNLDLYTIRIAIFFEVLGFVGYATTRTGSLFLLAGMFASMGGIGSPTLQSALTKHVPYDSIGRLMGATGLLHSLGRILAPVIFNLIYAATVGTFPQAIFVVLAVCFTVAFVCSWGIRPDVSPQDSISNGTPSSPSQHPIATNAPSSPSQYPVTISANGMTVEELSLF